MASPVYETILRRGGGEAPNAQSYYELKPPPKMYTLASGENFLRVYPSGVSKEDVDKLFQIKFPPLRIVAIRQVEPTSPLNHAFELKVSAKELDYWRVTFDGSYTRGVDRLWVTVNNIPKYTDEGGSNIEKLGSLNDLNGRPFIAQIDKSEALFIAGGPETKIIKLINTQPLRYTTRGNSAEDNEEVISGPPLGEFVEIPEKYKATVGCPFILVRDADRLGKCEITWEAPKNTPVDHYKVWQYIDGVWRLWGTTETEGISLSNTDSSTEDSVPSHINPFQRPLRSDGSPEGDILSKNFKPRDGYEPLENVDDLRRFPATTDFHGQRQVWAGSEANPLRIDWSDAGVFDSFSVSLIDNPSNSFYQTIDADQAEHVRHIVNKGELIIFTDKRERRVTTQGGAVEEGSVSIVNESSFGSSWVPPVLARDHIVMFDRSGTSVVGLRYDFSSNSLNPDDLSVFAKHLFKDTTIIDREYVEGITPHMFLVMEDGRLIVLTLFLEFDVYGWWEIKTKGKVRSVTAARDNRGKTKLHMIVERRADPTVSRPNVFFHETMEIEGDGEYLLDGGKEFRGAYIDDALAYLGDESREEVILWFPKATGGTDPTTFIKTGAVLFLEGITERLTKQGSGQVTEIPNRYFRGRRFKVKSVIETPQVADHDDAANAAGVPKIVSVPGTDPWTKVVLEAREQLYPQHNERVKAHNTRCRVVEGVNKIYGLDHLGGQEIGIFTGSQSEEDGELSAEPGERGSLTLNKYYPYIAAGLSYTTVVETLDLIPQGEMGRNVANVRRSVQKIALETSSPLTVRFGHSGSIIEKVSVDSLEGDRSVEVDGELKTIVERETDPTPSYSSSVIVEHGSPTPLGLKSINAAISVAAKDWPLPASSS